MSQPLDFTEYDTRVAAYAVIVDDQRRVLLSWFNGNGRNDPAWTMPGGGVEFDESPQDAVVREVFEETGYRVSLGPLLAVDHFTAAGYRDRPYKSVRIVFEASIIGGTLGTTEVGGSTDFAEWVALDSVDSLTPRADVVDLAIGAYASKTPA